MAKIKRKELSKQGAFYSSSPKIVTTDLYNFIAEELEKEIGVKVTKITKGRIKKIINDSAFKKKFSCKPGFLKGVEFTSAKGELLLLFVIKDIFYPKFCKHAEVTVSLRIPLRGDTGQVEEAVKIIASEIGLGEAPCFQNGIDIKVILSGKSLPYQIIPNPFTSLVYDGKTFGGRDAFITWDELMQNKPYSPIIE